MFLVSFTLELLRIDGEGNGNPLQYSWQLPALLVGYSPWGRLESDMTKQLHFHFSLFTFMLWRRKWQPTPVFLPGESQRRGSLVGCRPWGHTESDTTEQLHFHFSLFTSMHWRRKWQPTPVFLPGECQGRGNLVGCWLWGRTESDMTEAT